MKAKKLVIFLLVVTLSSTFACCGGGVSEAEQHYNAGVDLYDQGRFSEAIVEFNEAIELEPEMAEAYCNRGAAYIQLGNYERAIEDLDEAIRFDPQYADAYRNRGFAYFLLGEFDGAVEDLDEAIRLDPDELPPQDDDLQISRVDIPEKENGFYYFNQSIGKTYLPEDDEEYLVIMDILMGEEWDAELVDELMERNQESFSYFDEVFRYPNFQVPERTEFDPHLPVGPSIGIAQLESIRALCLFKQGREEAAFNETIKIIKIGQMLEGGGGLIEYLTGMVIKAIGLGRLQDMLPDTMLPPELLITYVDEIGELGANEEGLANAFKLEYLFLYKAFDEMSTVEEYVWDELEPLEGLDPEEITLIVGYLFKPNKTKRIFAETFRGMIDDIPKPCGEKQYLEPPLLVLDSSSNLKVVLSDNWIGEFLHDMVMISISGVLPRKCHEDFDVAGTQLLLAIKCYKANEGKIPQSLDELVPQYISEVPDDPFDGNPIRYSAEEKIIYSVGGDLEDSGGSEEDLVIRIEF